MRRGDYTLLLDWERRKKNLMPSSRIVFEIADLTHYKKKLWILCGWGYPFIVLVRESLIATKTHLVKTRLTRKRSQNKEEFLYEGRVWMGEELLSCDKKEVFFYWSSSLSGILWNVRVQILI